MIPQLPTDEAPQFSWRPFGVAAGLVALLLASWFFVIGPEIEAREDATTRQRLATCARAGRPEIPRLEPGLHASRQGIFVRWIARSAADEVFVSAEFRDRRLADGADGEVATWVLRGDADPLAAEPVAEERSTWKPSDDKQITRAQGFLDSRFCVVKLRDKKWRTELAKEH